MISGYEHTARDYADRAVGAALVGDYFHARFWLQAARNQASFRRVQELVSSLLSRLKKQIDRLNDFMTALEVFWEIDKNVITPVLT